MSTWDQLKAIVDQQDAALATAEAAIDDAVIALQGQKDLNTSLTTTVATLTAKVADLQAQLDKRGHTTPRGFYAGQDQVGGKESARQCYDRVRGYLGGPVVYRMFYSGSPGTFPGSNADWGPPCVVSFKFPPAEVISGKHDATLNTWFSSIPADREVWWSYFHEPENDIEDGAYTAAQYRQAWARILNLAPKRSTLHPTLILMEFTLRKTSRKVADYVVPGQEVLAWDAYLTAGSKTLDEVLKATKTVSDQNGMKFAIAECAVEKTYALPGQTHDQTVLALVNALKQTDAEFITWFESNKTDGDWRMRPSVDAVAAWKG